MWSAFSRTMQNVIFHAGGHLLFLVITRHSAKYRQFLTHSASCPSQRVPRVAVHARTPTSASRVHPQTDYSLRCQTTRASGPATVLSLTLQVKSADIHIHTYTHTHYHTLSIYLLSIYLSIYLSIFYLSIYLSIYLSLSLPWWSHHIFNEHHSRFTTLSHSETYA
jgi:hypothetical protein